MKKKSASKKALKSVENQPKKLTESEAKSIETLALRREIENLKHVILTRNKAIHAKDAGIASLLVELNNSRAREAENQILKQKTDMTKAGEKYRECVTAIKNRLGIEKDFGFNPDSLEVVD